MRKVRRRWGPEVEQKIVAMFKTGKYSEAEVGKICGVPRQTVWFILKRHGHTKTRAILQRHKLTKRNKVVNEKIPLTEERKYLTPGFDAMTIVWNRSNWNNNELAEIWGTMGRIFKKKGCSSIKIDGLIYHL